MSGPVLSPNPHAMSSPNNLGQAPSNPPSSRFQVFKDKEEALKAANNTPAAQKPQPAVIPNGWEIIKTNSTTVYLCIKDGIAKDRDLYMSYPLEELAKQISIHAYQKSTNPNAKTNFSMADVSKMLETYEKKPVSALSKLGNGLTAFGRKLTKEKFPTEKEQGDFLKAVLNDIVITTQAHQLGEVAKQIFAAKDKDGEAPQAFSLTVSGSTLHSLSVGDDKQNKRIQTVFNVNTLASNLKRATAENKEQHATMLKTAYLINDLIGSVKFNHPGEKPSGLGAYISWPPKLAWKAKIKDWEMDKNVRYLADVREDRENAIKKAHDDLIELNGKNDKELSEAETIQKKYLQEKLERLKISQIRDQESLGMGIAPNHKDTVSNKINTLLLNDLNIDEIMTEADAYQKQQSQKAEKSADDLKEDEEKEVEEDEKISHYHGERALLLKRELEALCNNPKEPLEFIETEKNKIRDEASKLLTLYYPNAQPEVILNSPFEKGKFNKELSEINSQIKQRVQQRVKVQDNEDALKPIDDEISNLKQKISDLKELRNLNLKFKNLKELEEWITKNSKVADADETDELKEKEKFEEDEDDASKPFPHRPSVSSVAGRGRPSDGSVSSIRSSVSIARPAPAPPAESVSNNDYSAYINAFKDAPGDDFEFQPHNSSADASSSIAPTAEPQAKTKEARISELKLRMIMTFNRFFSKEYFKDQNVGDRRVNAMLSDNSLMELIIKESSDPRNFLAIELKPPLVDYLMLTAPEFLKSIAPEEYAKLTPAE